MAKHTGVKRPTVRAVIEYENMGFRPAYVEGAQGMRTAQGALHVSFYSEYAKSKESLNGVIKNPLDSSSGDTQGVEVSFPDPFLSSDGEYRIVRRVESTLIFTEPFLRTLIPWLQIKLKELETDTGLGISRSEKKQ